MTVKIFFCYAHEDEALLNKLKAHLRPFQREGLLDLWHDRDISAGMEWKKEISKQINAANIILLLVSPDFMNSNYCYSEEMSHALERRKAGEAHIVPVILRPVEWKGTPIGDLQALPTEGKPIVTWRPHDRAFHIVAKGIRDLIGELAMPIFDSIPSAYKRHEERDTVTEQGGEQENQNDRILNIYVEPEKYGKSAAQGIYDLVQSWPDTYNINLARREGRIDSGTSFLAIWDEKQAIVFDKRYRHLRQELWRKQNEQIENEILQQLEDAKKAIRPLIDNEYISVVLAPYNAAPDTCEVFLQRGVARIKYKDNTNLGITTNSERAEIVASGNMFARMFYKPEAQEAYALSLLEIQAQSQEQLAKRFAIASAIVGMGSVYLASYSIDQSINPGEHYMARALLSNLPDNLRMINSYYQRLSIILASG